MNESPYEFDYPYWKAQFPMRFPLDDWYSRNGAFITSPVDVIVAEAMRQPVIEAGDIGPGIPTDLFVFAKGEPARRDVTKIGGLPYRPAGLPWPRTSTGDAFDFIGQLRFTESRDLVGELPGDLLLVFAPDETAAPGDEMHFEWWPLGLTDLVQPADVPPRHWEYVTCYGARFRTVDYPDRRATEAAEATYPDSQIWQFWSTPIYQSTKVGGAPFAPFGPDDDLQRDLPGQFLGQIGSIDPINDLPFPWLNEPTPIPLSREPKCLEWGDSGTIYLSLDQGQVYWTGFSY